MRGIIPMKTQGQISRVAVQPRTVTAGASAGAHRADPWFKTTRGAAILVLVVGSLGAATAESLSHSGGSAGARHATGTVHLSHSHHAHANGGLSAVTSRPWMW
jgi:hypothetical protein